MLEFRNTKLAVVEAKAWDQALTEGVAQAKNYAGKLEVRFAYGPHKSRVVRAAIRQATDMVGLQIMNTGICLERRGAVAAFTNNP